MTTPFSSKQSSALLAALLLLALMSFPARANVSTFMETGDRSSCGWELIFEVQVGAHELRGGSDNLDVIITYYNRAPQRVANVNRGRRWAAGTTQQVLVLLEEPEGPDMIADIELRASSMEERWDVDALAVVAHGEGRQKELYRASGAPLFTFAEEHTNWALLR